MLELSLEMAFRWRMMLPMLYLLSFLVRKTDGVTPGKFVLESTGIYH